MDTPYLAQPRGTMLHALGVLALILAYLAALAAIAAGNTTLSLAGIFSDDTVRLWLIYRGLFHDAGWELGDWAFKNTTHVLDLLLNGMLFAVGSVFGSASRAQFLFGMYATFMAWSCISALGWILLVRQAWGRDPVRETAVLVAHALPFACIAFGQEYFFVMWLWLVFHVAPWAMLPWLMWMMLRASRETGWQWQAAFLAALFAVTFADTLIIVWFTVPAIVALPLARLLGEPRTQKIGVLARRFGIDLLRHGLPLALVTALGMAAANLMLYKGRPVVVSWESAKQALGHYPPYLNMALEYSAVLVPVLVAFIIIAVGWPLLRLRRWWQGGSFEVVSESTGQQDRFAPCARTILALMLPGMMLVPVLATVVTGLALPVSDMAAWGEEVRYILPTIWLPLFVGWTLLPYRLPRAGVAGAAGLVAVASVAYMGVVRPAWQGLNPFATAFHDCFATHAREHGWVSGMGGFEYLWLLADPDTPLQRFMPLGIDSARGQGEESLYYFKDNTNTGWVRDTFDFIVVNESAANPLVFPPLDTQANTCFGPDHIDCAPRGRVISEALAREISGDDSELLECAGVRVATIESARSFTFNS